MARIYISSTFTDLKDCRERVARALRRLQHDVVAMEEYVARDDRPADACIKDVARCDIYVGLFAHRYGYVPVDPQLNPNNLSITELELRAAQQGGKTCLVFLQDPAAGWPFAQTDSFSGENEQGKRIAALRKDLQESKLASFFKGPEDLGELVAASVTNELADPDADPIVPDPRQLGGDCLIVYSPADDADVKVVAAALQRQQLRVKLAPRALFSASAAEFEELDADARTHQAALVYLSAKSLAQFAGTAADKRRILSVLHARTDCLIALVHAAAPDPPADWPFSVTVRVDPAAAAPLDVAAVVGELEQRCPTLRVRAVVGLPVVVVAMTKAEADALMQNPQQAGDLLSAKNVARFEELRQCLEKSGQDWTDRYASRRHEWRPLGGTDSVATLLKEIVKRLNGSRSGVGAQRKIKLQYYPIDPILSADPLLRSVYMSMVRTGCVAIVDELSLFHPALRPQAQKLLNQPQVSVMTVAPLASQRAFEDLLVSEARRQLGAPFDRFDLDLDPQCEFGVEEERHLLRWLHRSLPETMRQVGKPGPDRQRLEVFKKQVGQRQGFDDVLFPGAGGQ
jgi:hypothetical protein